MKNSVCLKLYQEQQALRSINLINFNRSVISGLISLSSHFELRQHLRFYNLSLRDISHQECQSLALLIEVVAALLKRDLRRKIKEETMKTDFSLPSQQSMAAVAAEFFNQTILESDQLLSYINGVISEFWRKPMGLQEKDAPFEEFERRLFLFDIKNIPSCYNQLFEAIQPKIEPLDYLNIVRFETRKHLVCKIIEIMKIGLTENGYQALLEKSKNNKLQIQPEWLKLSPIRTVKLSQRINPGLKLIIEHNIKFKGNFQTAFDYLRNLPIDSLIYQFPKIADLIDFDLPPDSKVQAFMLSQYSPQTKRRKGEPPIRVLCTQNFNMLAMLIFMSLEDWLASPLNKQAYHKPYSLNWNIYSNFPEEEKLSIKQIILKLYLAFESCYHMDDVLPSSANQDDAPQHKHLSPIYFKLLLTWALLENSLSSQRAFDLAIEGLKRTVSCDCPYLLKALTMQALAKTSKHKYEEAIAIMQDLLDNLRIIQGDAHQTVKILKLGVMAVIKHRQEHHLRQSSQN